jgi:hypothetical protein
VFETAQGHQGRRNSKVRRRFAPVIPGFRGDRFHERADVAGASASATLRASGAGPVIWMAPRSGFRRSPQLGDTRIWQAAGPCAATGRHLLPCERSTRVTTLATGAPRRRVRSCGQTARGRAGLPGPRRIAVGCTNTCHCLACSSPRRRRACRSGGLGLQRLRDQRRPARSG